MVRSLSAFAAAVAFALGLSSSASAVQGMAANSESELRTCFKQATAGPVECVIDQPIRFTTRNSSAVAAGYLSTVSVPATSSPVSIVIRFANPSGCLVWDHSGTEPSNTVDMLRIDAPAAVALGSRIVIRDACARELRSGVAGGGRTTNVRGIAITGAGAGEVAVSVDGALRDELASGGPLTSVQAGGSVSTDGLPGVAAGVGDDSTINYLLGLPRFQAVSSQVTSTVWVDPIFGNDATGDGSYAAPYFSFAKIKTECLLVPGSRCIVKGRDRIFSHTLLTVSYTSSSRALMPGDTVTFTTPTGTATVLAVHSDNVVVRWLSGADPRDQGATTFSAGGGAATGSVTAVRDSLNGFPARKIASTDINTTTDVITSAGHSYSNGDGPFWFYSQNNNQTFSANAITEATTNVYICGVVAGTSFQLGTDAACTGGLVANFSSAGTGSMQILAGLDWQGLRKPIDITCGDPSRICTLITSEFAESPWGIDSANLPGDGALYTEVNVQRWPDAQGGTYNTPTGGLLFIAPASADPLLSGWLGIENAVISGLADDCLAAGPGGKIVALRVRCNVVNGLGDRGQNGTNPRYQAHNSGATVYGTNLTDATAAAGILVWIGADGSSGQMGSDKGSGGFLNPNGNGVLRLISRGVITYDGVTGATDCGGGPCNSPVMVAPGGDAVVIGPHFKIGGTTKLSQLLASSGTNGDVVFAKIVAEAVGTAASSTLADGSFFNFAGGGQGATRTIRGYNVTFHARGPQMMAIMCPLQGTTAATATSRLDVLFENTLAEWVGTASSYRFSVSNCGLGGYTHADSAARAAVKFRGVFDIDDDAACGAGPCGFLSPNSRAMGSCGSTSFLNDVCNAVDSSGAKADPTAWEWFGSGSGDSGGAGVDGLSWRSTDPQLRCQAGQACAGGTYANLASYLIDFHDAFKGSAISCIPADVAGAQLCGFRLRSVNVGAR